MGDKLLIRRRGQERARERDELTLAEQVRARDYDGLEARLVDLLTWPFRNPRTGRRSSVYRRGLPTMRQDAGFTLVVIASSLSSLYVLGRLQEQQVHVVLQALAVFVVTTVVWLPWLAPYLRDLLRRLEARFAR